MTKQISILDQPREVLAEQVATAGQPAYRLAQLWQGLYHSYWQEWSDYSTLSKEFRDKLARFYSPFPLTLVRKLVSKDGQTTKALFDLLDGLSIETVLMTYEQRRTICISSQVGCSMACAFCATGQMGYKRNLTIGEMVAQVLFFARELKELNQTVTNVVIMGMGEPFMNYDTVLASIGRLNDPTGFNLGARHFTLSTVGIPERIRQFADQRSQVNLAVSLHAATDEIRNRIVPINRTFSINQVMEACHYYSDQTNRRITFEWALIKDLNDMPDQANQLAHLLRGLRCHVNLIPLNPTELFSHDPTTRERAESFKKVLDEQHIPCTIRLRRGIEIQAGCGQLASHEQNHR